MIVKSLVECNGMVGHGVYLLAVLVFIVFGLPEGVSNAIDKALKESMDEEFGKNDGTRHYFVLKNVHNLEVMQQLKWFLEKVMLLVKLDYTSRKTYAILSEVEKERKFG
ncbi:hypothetical protein GOP47_0007727 [Adiantum capillus-veneris]|uniref:Uncharacterized protein n=1 Tax=Adiantum capillus-veneris TaxID=13818 RepID=A0A9D4ZJH9_ADICA|nr:hypothetical protein GOP47_0007727 [Adiantum capillus-veneris]